MDDEPEASDKEAKEQPKRRSGTHYLRQPIVSVLGHVDHGKTTLLDKIRGGTVASREPGAITQHIGATEVPLATILRTVGPLGGKARFSVPGLLFIDTPGHHSFNALRARGGALADLAILVVDLTEGLMPQTVEAIKILKRSKTPFVVAANKLDKIPMYASKREGAFIANYAAQTPSVQASLDERLFSLIGRLFQEKLPADRYDRIQDFTKNVAVVPVSALTGEGVPDLLLVLVGLAQRFLESRLETSEEGPGIGTVLEVKEERGLGLTVDAIVYGGTLRASDRLVLSGRTEPVTTTIRALLKPKALDEIRDPREPFERVRQVHAAAGVKIVAPGLEEVLPGAALRALRRGEDEEGVRAAVQQESAIHIPLDDYGVVIKADTLGSLEALATELASKEVKIRSAGVGDVARRDVVTAATTDEPLDKVLLAFNVKVLPDAQQELVERNLSVLSSNVIYQVLDAFDEWLVKAKAEKEKAERKEVQYPAMLRFLPGKTFRVSGPAVIGVRVLAGRVGPGRKLLRSDGRSLGAIASVQKEGKPVAEAIQGAEVAIAIPGVTVGRQIKEDAILYLDLPGSDAKTLFARTELSTDEREVLEKVARIKRKHDRFWGM